MDIVVRVPRSEIEHFWDEVPEDNIEWWTLGRRPIKLREHGRIWFAIDRHIVALASNVKLDDGTLICEATGRTYQGHHIVWRASAFRPLDPPLPLGAILVPRGFAYLDTYSADWGLIITPEKATVLRKSATER